ncbi:MULTISPECIES: hypothetical protein [unclassified Oceanobacter]|jgi:transcription elongation factor Elf1|uniref:hypothetical protein n=1 Tax=unclassified Oceanobacter TaxID=2620260 RepID=UPI0026E42131|nr:MULTISPECIES: hypothetical protein [unclassified Oceanobacter]MDO6681835.1 hypothetical protein [Oceanobacter sp. 5_MG-2023]MDP2549380.1 hypothetical protein [Oceanobacter sp. 4_MG-2023]MDP2609421.1 hypothetical protein [Oceanobacter sp. 1_MG-2023]MDP2612879.1 hypothetical protein [Oceanobacter sp. 2_MG-2023]
MSTILPAETEIPVTCDECNTDTPIALVELRSLALITCQHCGNQRQFTQAELDVMRLVLVQAGYRFL